MAIFPHPQNSQSDFMARHKKPALLKELNGSAAHDPGRVNQNAPVPARGIGPAPDHFCEARVELWDYLVRIMHPGVLGEPDRLTFELMVELYYRHRFGDREKDSVLPVLNGGEMNQLISLAARFGMTPADRQKISMPEGKKKNAFGDL